MLKNISIIIPAYNEADGIATFYQSLKKTLPKNYNYELLFVDDGSRDTTRLELHKLAKKDSSVKVLSFSKNFGKEAATSAGIHESTGDAIIMLDADGQHPVELIKDFLKKWESGAQVVIGIRTDNQGEGFIKRYGSKAFYKIFNSMTKESIIPGSTDFRLIDKEVRDAFIGLEEKSRITRALIDWLGYDREYIEFTANAREFGEASYSTGKLVKLAMNSFVSLTTLPLFLSGYIGLVITPLSALLGIAVIVQQYLLGDPLHWQFTGSASLGILIIFLVGITLICQGLVALYVSRVYEESKNRPLYLINNARSKR